MLRFEFAGSCAGRRDLVSACVPGRASEPGLAPAGELHVGICARLRSNFLLLRQKKVTKEKASRIRRPFAALRARCVAQLRRGARKLAALKHTRPLIRQSLRYSPPHNGVGNQSPIPNPTRTRHGASLFAFRLFCIPRRYEEASSTGADGSGLALSERSEFSQTPADPSNAAYRRSRATNPARLSLLTFFGEAKKVSALSGAQPDTLPRRGKHPKRGQAHAQ
jgi:hypothetical protein